MKIKLYSDNQFTNHKKVLMHLKYELVPLSQDCQKRHLDRPFTDTSIGILNDVISKLNRIEKPALLYPSELDSKCWNDIKAYTVIIQKSIDTIRYSYNTQILELVVYKIIIIRYRYFEFKSTKDIFFDG